MIQQWIMFLKSGHPIVEVIQSAQDQKGAVTTVSPLPQEGDAGLSGAHGSRLTMTCCLSWNSSEVDFVLVCCDTTECLTWFCAVIHSGRAPLSHHSGLFNACL